MKLSCTPISLGPSFRDGSMDLPRYIEFCAIHGCAGIDLLDSQCYPWVWHDSAAEKKSLPRWLADAGLKLVGHGCGNNFAAADPAERAAEVEKVKYALHEAAELGAPVLRVFGGRIEPERMEAGLGSHVGLPLVIEGLEQCLSEAERTGVVLALENHGNLPGHSFELASVIERFDSPYLRCMFDCANFMGNSMDEPEDPLRALERLRRYIAHVHIKDVGPPEHFKERRSEGYVAGEGQTPLRQLTYELESTGYEGYYTLEYEAAFKVPDQEGAARSLAYLRNVAQLHESLLGSRHPSRTAW